MDRVMSADPSESQSAWAKVQRKILASRFLTVSLLMHLLLVVFFGGTVLFNKYVEPPDFAAEGEGFLTSDVQVTAPAPENPAEAQTPTFSVAPPPPMAASLSAITTTNLAVQNFTLNAMPVVAPSLSNVISEKIAAAPAKAMSGLTS